MKKSIFTVSAIAVLCAGTAFAQSAPEFSEIDSNMDGVLNKKEADTSLPALGIQDADQNGVISKGEVKSALAEVDFSETDTGAVGEAEYQQIVRVIEAQINEISG